MAKQLIRKGQRKLELTSLNAAHGERVFDITEVVFCHRILWVSQ
jgi:phage repressor protein C with HTH and peptisase S24 domain